MAQRTTCTRAKVGALIVRDGRIISTGYAGAPSNLPHCSEVGCNLGTHGGCTRTVHAEANSIAFAAREGIATKGATMFTSLFPCLECAKLIINSGIEEVYYLDRYRDMSAKEMLEEAGVGVFNYWETS